MKAFAILFSDLYAVAVSIWNLLVFRLAMLFFFALAAALLLSIAGNINETIHPFFFDLTSAAAEGMLLGVLARLFYRDNTLALRLAAVLAALLAGLFYMGWITGGFVGIPPLPFPRSQPDRLALVLTAAGLIGAILPLFAWRRPSSRRSQIEPAPLEIPVSGDAPAEDRPSLAVHAAPTSRPSSFRWPSNFRLRMPVRWLRERGRDIRLVGAEEHRCPYCLQPVGRRDPRGIVICPDCHTWHHKDCWSVTGMCQIPHEHPV